MSHYQKLLLTVSQLAFPAVPLAMVEHSRLVSLVPQGGYLEMEDLFPLNVVSLLPPPTVQTVILQALASPVTRDFTSTAELAQVCNKF